LIDWGSILSFFSDRLGYILTFILAIIIYELVKYSGKKTVGWITRNKPKAGIYIAIAIFIALLVILL